jgi:peptidoglycan hydrolase-like protein with peptidoglycan-binding domain
MAQSTPSQHNPNANQNWTYEQNAAMPNGRIYPGDIYGPSVVLNAPTAQLNSATSGSAAGPARMPQYSSGDQARVTDMRDPQVVAAVQRALNQRGYQLAENGVAGTDTRNALVAYQTNTGLHPTGTIDSATLAALNVQVSEVQTGPRAGPQETSPTMNPSSVGRSGATPR